MPKIWENCLKIHAGCGGICRWVEAVDRPAVGYTGECTHCDSTNIPAEGMVPLEGFDYEQIAQKTSPGDLENLQWEDEDDWEENQLRLTAEVNKVAG